ncbi:hypothetical protein [Streptomyces sp. NPDC048385]|uniref:hypothetical protein n=1 Tax=unclassified Streptomyces TaxID=2593676 RepID=UPI00343C7E4B
MGSTRHVLLRPAGSPAGSGERNCSVHDPWITEVVQADAAPPRNVLTVGAAAFAALLDLVKSGDVR